MGSRRSHTKSRNGCIQCKARRIKCDERSSQCSNCVRRQISCVYPVRRLSTSSSSSNPRAHARSSTLTSPGIVSPSQGPAVAAAAAVSTAIPSSPVNNNTNNTTNGSTLTAFAGLDIIDLELLHHYTTFTYKTLPSGAAPDQHELWQIQVVQLGFQHEFLLRGILAVSALHLASLRPNRRETLHLRATTHQSTAVQLFHEALNRVTTSNCVSIFAFSCIVVVLTFAAPRPGATDDADADADADGDDRCARVQKEILDWFYMVRGCNSVLQTQWETLSRSFLAPLLKKGMMHETAASHNVRNTDQVTTLLRLCSDERLSHDREAANAYALAIHELLNAYTQVSILTERKQDFVPVIYVWPIAIPQFYLVLLSEHKPEALVILAHYAALLQRVDDQWYMKGWGCYLVQQIETALGEEWQTWLSWPKEVTGVPKI